MKKSGRFLEIRHHPSGKLLCKYNPSTHVIQVKRGRAVYTVRLPIRPYRARRSDREKADP